jgi:hypothetical protein
VAAGPICGPPKPLRGELPAGSDGRCRRCYSSPAELDVELRIPFAKEMSGTSLLDLWSGRVVFGNREESQVGTVPPRLRARLRRSACLCGLDVGDGDFG